MCAEYQGPLDTYRRLQIDHLHLPTLDGTPPSVESVRKALEFIKKYESRNDGSRVLVHCKGGRGRAASVCICYMLQIKEVSSPEEAYKVLFSRRPILEHKVLDYTFLFQEFVRDVPFFSQ
ncbi:hypothetical protein ACOME3_005966 [Neoechinorhynchus agilis]